MPIIHKEDTEWKEGGFKNSEYRFLWNEKTESTHKQAIIVRFGPNGYIPKHDHPGREYAYVLEGEMIVDGKKLVKGDFLTAGSGEIHTVSTKTGVTFLSIIENDIEIIGED
ncbi:cupin domain-containing protein [Virgibacillus dokdonensis]|uniref:cupin domain-containing protein n=1 Tax=Virgibacillus dokdonensis TaxID=302167 RepID=UPI00098A06F1|nr:cupin domain-containing protein [Virgibacillus dokdonensis]